MESSQLRLDSSAASTDVNERVLLNGVDSSSTGDGYAVILEDAPAHAFDGGPFVLSEAPISVANPAFKAIMQTGISGNQCFGRLRNLTIINNKTNQTNNTLKKNKKTKK